MSVQVIGLETYPTASSAVTHKLGKNFLELTDCRIATAALVSNAKLSNWLLVALHLLYCGVLSRVAVRLKLPLSGTVQLSCKTVLFRFDYIAR
ncbi:hypothetical protein VCO01S_02640 [Vibrio comitans NBRC 102076]|uniref:Uncharacterized protein n=1 Tax=Vibrio comitans NBRC 102076 TaxID=1219078 RepID=A0A4Y3II36_9VIBR|nr:hypothetical protein VCO01S_02640 [Vibrio comitans NBRC 102076]